MHNVTIIKATENDLKLYKAIRLETLQLELQAFSSKYEDALQFEDNHWQSLLNDEQSAYLLAIDNDKAIGVMRVTFNDDEEPENTAVIGGAYVRKSYRGREIGKKLLNTLVDLARKEMPDGVIKLYVKPTQLGAIKLYESAGFVKQGVKDDEIVMVK